jgi:hypothetical protein
MAVVRFVHRIKVDPGRLDLALDLSPVALWVVAGQIAPGPHRSPNATNG